MLLLESRLLAYTQLKAIKLPIFAVSRLLIKVIEHPPPLCSSRAGFAAC